MPRSITAVNNLLQRAYWERTWIQQEIALPPMVMVQCGNERLSLIAFIGFANTISRIDVARQRECWTGFNCHMIPSGVDGIPFFRLIHLRLSQLGAWKEDGDSNLWKSLYTSFGFKSTDPRDHIYALLELTRFEKYRSLLCPSYTKSASHVFSEAARNTIEEENSLEPLAIACAFCCSNISLPSWVSDWVADEVTFISFDCTQSDLTHRKGKSVSPVVDISDFVSFSADGKILSATGILHDEASFLKDDLLPNGLTVLEAVFRIFIKLHINITLDSYRGEDISKFVSEVQTFVAMVCDGTDYSGSLRLFSRH